VTRLRDAAAAAGPGSKYRSTVRLQLAEALLERQQLDEAEGLLHGEEDKPEYRLRVAYDLGLIALARDDRPAATKYLELAGQSPVVQQRAAALLATLARARGDQPAAVRYENVSTAAPSGMRWPDPFLHEVVDLQVGQGGVRARAQRMEEEGRYDEAADLLLELARTQPAARTLTEAGMNFTRAGRIDRALPLLREAVRLAPDSPQARYNLALTLFTQAEKENVRTPGAAEVRAAFEEVVQHASRAAELKPDYGMAYLFWGLSLKHLGRTGAAVEPLRKGVAARPEEFELQLALGEVLVATGRGAEAKTYLDNAARLDPKDPRPA
jgi:tetratricopeptide (TPR) repeat protein